MRDRRANVVEWLLVATLIAASVLLRSRALSMPRAVDDWAHQQMLDGTFPVHRSAWSLYDFGGRNDHERRALMDAGAWPWWSHPQLSFVLFRPISSALLRVDAALFRSNTTAAHAHSLLWWALALLAVHCWLRQLFPVRLALLALALLTVEEAATLPVVWLANRNALVAMTFACFGLAALTAARTQASTRLALLAAALLFASLLASEYALCFFGYALVTEVRTATATTLRLRTSIVAWLSPLLLWLVLYRLYGAGVHGSSVYIDPLSDPRRFAAVLPVRVAFLLRDLLTTLPVDDPSPKLLGVALRPVALACMVLLPAVAWSLRSSAPTTRRAVLALGVGALLALLPTAGSFNSTRLALAASIGIAVLMATVLDCTLQSLSSRPATMKTRLEALLLVAVAIPIVALHGLRAARNVRLETESWIQAYVSNERALAHSQLDATAMRNGTLIVVAAVDAQTMLYAPAVLAAHGMPRLRDWRVLSVHSGPVLVRRTNDRTLDVSLLGGEWLSTPAETLFRTGEQRLSPGQRIVLRGMTAIVERMRFSGPFRMQFEFDRSLDDRSMQLVYARRDGLLRIPTPAIGAMIMLPAAQGLSR